ncbi:hypothetical protein [Moorena sp. SIO3F7]|nr:hypothetical protein [Moorena sp. SIO3F7]
MRYAHAARTAFSIQLKLFFVGDVAMMPFCGVASVASIMNG